MPLNNSVGAGGDLEFCASVTGCGFVERLGFYFVGGVEAVWADAASEPDAKNHRANQSPPFMEFLLRGLLRDKYEHFAVPRSGTLEISHRP